MYKLSSSQTRNSPLYLEPCSEAPFMKFGRNKHVIETTEVKADIPSQVSHKMCLQLSPRYMNQSLASDGVRQVRHPDEPFSMRASELASPSNSPWLHSPSYYKRKLSSSIIEFEKLLVPSLWFTGSSVTSLTGD